MAAHTAESGIYVENSLLVYAYVGACAGTRSILNLTYSLKIGNSLISLLIGPTPNRGEAGRLISQVHVILQSTSVRLLTVLFQELNPM